VWRWLLVVTSAAGLVAMHNFVAAAKNSSPWPWPWPSPKVT
jgi:hypothetical protein